MEQLLQKLMISKKIMDKHNSIDRGNSSRNYVSEDTNYQDFSTPQVKYNIPDEFLQQESNTISPISPDVVRENTKPVGVPTVEAIKNSKLPDEIKRLMLEHPISQPQQPTATLSNELIEKASRLMRNEPSNYVPESAKPKQKIVESNSNGIDYNIIKKMIKEAVDSALRENGMLVESNEKTNEIFSFKVGKHIFEGKVTKIKKIS